MNLNDAKKMLDTAEKNYITALLSDAYNVESKINKKLTPGDFGLTDNGLTDPKPLFIVLLEGSNNKKYINSSQNLKYFTENIRYDIEQNILKGFFSKDLDFSVSQKITITQQYYTVVDKNVKENLDTENNIILASTSLLDLEKKYLEDNLNLFKLNPQEFKVNHSEKYLDLRVKAESYFNSDLSDNNDFITNLYSLIDAIDSTILSIDKLTDLEQVKFSISEIDLDISDFPVDSIVEHEKHGKGRIVGLLSNSVIVKFDNPLPYLKQTAISGYNGNPTNPYEDTDECDLNEIKVLNTPDQDYEIKGI